MKTNTFFCIICSILMIFILTAPKETVAVTSSTVNLWVTSVFPALFPFFVLTSILKQTGVGERAIYRLSEKRDYNLMFITAIGLVCGYPSSSKLIGQSDAVQNPVPTYALSTCPSPIFTVGTVSALFLGNSLFALYLLPAVYSALLTSYFIAKWIFPAEKSKRSKPKPIKQKSFGSLLTTAISDGMKSQGIILGIMITVAVLGLFLDKTGFFYLLELCLSPLLKALSVPPVIIVPFAKGLLEMTTGLNAVCTQNIPLFHKLSACGFICAFGGMSVICESISFINDKIKATAIIVIKLIHGCLTCIYIRIILFLFPVATETAIVYGGPKETTPFMLLIVSTVTAFVILSGLRRIARRDS